jgi:HemY protein
MLDDPEMRLIGLRGLYLEAERVGDRSAARHYAARAADIAPQLQWASDSTLGDKVVQGDWDGAVKLVDAHKPALPAERTAASRRRAVLLTGKAMALLDSDFTAAKAAALEANRLQPDFVPAALIAAKVLFRANDTRKGARILETVWKTNPHPEVADLYTHARHGDAVNDRLARARRLQSIKQNHAESSLAVARAAIDAGDYRLARAETESAIRMQPREGAWLLLADIEEADTGDIGKVREHLGKAVRAPRDPAWVADGFESDKWAPISPVTGRLDAFEWRVPVERLGALIEDEREAAKPARKPVLVAPATAAEEPVEAEIIEAAVEPEAARTVTPEPANDRKPTEADAAPERDADEGDRAADETADITPPLPDDPGVAPDEAAKPRKRFSLF